MAFDKFYIPMDSLSINADTSAGNNFIRISTSGNAVFSLFSDINDPLINKSGILNEQLGVRQWIITVYNIRLNTNTPVYICAMLSRKEGTTFAYIGLFQSVPANNDDFVYIKIGLITAFPAREVSKSFGRPADAETAQLLSDMFNLINNDPDPKKHYIRANYHFKLADGFTIKDVQGEEARIEGVAIDRGEEAAASSEVTSYDNLLMTTVAWVKRNFSISVFSKYFLRKDKADTAIESITFKKGIKSNEVSSENYAPGGFAGAGYRVGTDANGDSHMEVDLLSVRKKMFINESHINQITFIKGENVFTQGGCEITSVENDGSHWKCLYDTREGTFTSGFQVGDFARCQRWDPSSVQPTKYYWRRVTSIGDGFVSLSKTDAGANSDDPSAMDNIVQFGNNSDTTRQKAVVIDLKFGITILANINSYSLSGKQFVSVGYDLDKAIFNCFGDAYIGRRDKSSGLEYNATTGEMSFKGKASFASGSSGLTNLEEWNEAAQDIQASQKVANEAKRLAQEEEQARIDAINSVNATIGSLQDQLDGVVENWYYEAEPTTNNYPANTWTTAEVKRNHVGDTYTSIAQVPAPQAGKSWRWIEEGGTFRWTPISDNDAVKALQEAAKAKATADGKSTTFLVQPSKYSVGDMWILSADWNGFRQGDMLTANIGRDNFVASDWRKKLRYTDDTAVNNIQIGGVNTYGSKTDIDSIGIDAEIFGQTSNGFIVFMNDNIGNQCQKRLNKTITSNGWWTYSFNCKIYSEIWSYMDSYLVVDICDLGYETFYFESNHQTLKINKSVYVSNFSENVYNFVDILFYNDQQDANNILHNVVFEITNLKIEAGNKPTAWTPSIEDTEEGIANAKQTGEMALSTANSAQGAINAMNNDTVFDLVEKQTIRTQWEKISGVASTSANHGTNGSYFKALTEISKVSSLDSYRIALNLAYNALSANLNTNGLYVNSNKTGFDRQTMAKAFANYGNAEVACYNAIQEHYTSIAQQTANTATVPSVVVETSVDQVLRGEDFTPSTLSARRVLKVGDRKEVLDKERLLLPYSAEWTCSGWSSEQPLIVDNDVCFKAINGWQTTSRNLGKNVKRLFVSFQMEKAWNPAYKYFLSKISDYPNENQRIEITPTTEYPNFMAFSDVLDWDSNVFGILIRGADESGQGHELYLRNLVVLDYSDVIDFSGRNYLNLSNSFSGGYGGYGLQVSKNEDAYLVVTSAAGNGNYVGGFLNSSNKFDQLGFVSGDKVTAILWIKTTANLLPSFYFNQTTEYVPLIGECSSTEFKPCYCTIRYSKYESGEKNYHLGFNYYGTVVGTTTIKAIKFIKGEYTPQDWQPAPEDAMLKLNGADYSPNTPITIANNPKDNYLFVAEWNGATSSKNVPVVSGKDAWDKAASVDYMKEATSNGKTILNGGLALSNLMAVESSEAGDDTSGRYIRAGMSGLPSDGLAFFADPNDAYNKALDYINGRSHVKPQFMVDDFGSGIWGVMDIGSDRVVISDQNKNQVIICNDIKKIIDEPKTLYLGDSFINGYSADTSYIDESSGYPDRRVEELLRNTSVIPIACQLKEVRVYVDLSLVMSYQEIDQGASQGVAYKSSAYLDFKVRTKIYNNEKLLIQTEWLVLNGDYRGIKDSQNEYIYLAEETRDLNIQKGTLTIISEGYYHIDMQGHYVMDEYGTYWTIPAEFTMSFGSDGADLMMYNNRIILSSDGIYADLSNNPNSIKKGMMYRDNNGFVKIK